MRVLFGNPNNINKWMEVNASINVYRSERVNYSINYFIPFNIVKILSVFEIVCLFILIKLMLTVAYSKKYNLMEINGRVFILIIIRNNTILRDWFIKNREEWMDGLKTIEKYITIKKEYSKEGVS